MMKITTTYGDIILGYLEQFTPTLLMFGLIFIGAYLAPIFFTAFDGVKEKQQNKADS